MLFPLLKNPPTFSPQHPELKPVFQDVSELDDKLRGQIRCVICRHTITNKESIKSVSGAHIHKFTNPHGIKFTIGCFDSAPGCVPVGGQYSEWSWFLGTTWQLVLCGSCAEHLGWKYLYDDNSEFFGLNIAQLFYDQSDS